jgi:hypothetical protein
MKRAFIFIISAISCCFSYAQPTVGLFSHTTASQDGYVLFGPMFSHATYLIDKCGKLVHTWNAGANPGLSVNLLPDGQLLRPAQSGNTTFGVGGAGGTIELLDWNSNLTWSYSISSTTECQHHDVCRLPNGNILAVVWESKTASDAISMGRNPAKVGATLWSEKIVELHPYGKDSAALVWQWRVWDHLIQDFDSTMQNYGVVADHPELIDINHYEGNPLNPDWLHMNSVAYNADLDQIMVCSYYFNELWVIDHATSKAAVTGHTGGARNKGGDLLYRWGNPEAYGRGTPNDRKLFSPHDPHWIAPGYPGQGRIVIYNNGSGRNYSTVEEIDPPIDAQGNYLPIGTGPFAPSSAYWQYKAPNPPDFYSPIISGAERLSGGNTLICEGTKGKLFEVDNQGNILWEYVNPVGLTGVVSQGSVPVQNYVFRCQQYPASYSGFAGQVLAAGVEIEHNPISIPCFLNTTAVNNVSKDDGEIQVMNPFDNNIVINSSKDGKGIHATLINNMGMLCGEWNLDVRKGIPARLDITNALTQGVYLLRLEGGGMQQHVKLLHY